MRNKINKDDFDGYIQFKSSEKFYKISGRTKHIAKSSKKINKFKKLIKNKLNQENRSCQICNSKSKKLLFNKNGYDHVICKNCEFVYVDPILKKNVQLKALKKENSYINVMKNKINIKLDNLRFQYGLQKLNVKKKNKTILDFGTGYGLFLENAKKKGWACYANEVNEDCINHLRKRNIKIDNNFKKNFYDAITLWLVLEHVPYPNKLLRKIYKSLKRGGKLLINVPNINSLSALLLKDKCTMFSGSQHVNHFSDNTLKKILIKNNFKIENSETIISDAGTAINFLNNESPYSSNTKRQYAFTKPSFIHKEMLGYTLLTIARKK